MYYFLHGTDTLKTIDKAKTLIDALQKKKPNASLFKVTPDNFSVSQLQELIVSQALFENKYIVYLSRLFEDGETKETLLGYLKDLKESENVFVWVEDSVNKTDLKKIEKHAEKVQEFQEKEKAKKIEFNMFALTDALGNRDKKKLWLLYQEAIESGSPEEIHGILFWQMKTMLLVSKAKTAAETGLKPFVFNKAKGFNKNYSEKEIDSLSSKLISLVHESRRGKGDLGILLERFCLEI